MSQLKALRTEQRETHPWLLVLACTFIVIFLFAVFTYLQFGGFLPYATPSTPQDFGSSFGSINALFSALAFGGILVTLYLQSRAIQIQGKSLVETIATQQAMTKTQSINTLTSALDQYSHWAQKTSFPEVPAFELLPVIIRDSRIRNKLALQIDQLFPGLVDGGSVLRTTLFEADAFKRRERFVTAMHQLCQRLDRNCRAADAMCPFKYRKDDKPTDVGVLSWVADDLVEFCFRQVSDTGMIARIPQAQSLLREMVTSEKKISNPTLKDWKNRANEIFSLPKGDIDKLVANAPIVCVGGMRQELRRGEDPFPVLSKELVRVSCFGLAASVPLAGFVLDDSFPPTDALQSIPGHEAIYKYVSRVG